jgi:hypothetical protein
MARGFTVHHLTPKQLLDRAGITQRIQDGLEKAGLALVATWKEVLSTPGRGEFYPRGTRFLTIGGRTFATIDLEEGRSADHVASAPGDPPAPDTGGLRNSIDMEAEPGLVTVGTGNPVAAWQEFGVGTAEALGGPHPGGIVIEPRPHGRPALERALPLMNRVMAEALRGE